MNNNNIKNILKKSIKKFLIIFSVGFVSRILVGYFYSNIYLDFLSPVFIIYNICKSAFMFLIYLDYFIIPSFSFIYEICTSIINITGFIIRILVSMNTRIFSYKLEDIKISFIIKGAKYLFNRDKAMLDLNQLDTYSKNYNRTKTLNSKSIKGNTYILEKNGNESKKILPKTKTYSAVMARQEEIRWRSS